MRLRSQPRCRAISVTLPRTVRWGKSPPSCTTKPIRRRKAAALACVTASPSSETVPVVGTTRPAMSRSSVDFPDPLGPINTVVRPAGTVRSVACKTSTPPYDLVTPRRVNMHSWYDLNALPESDVAGDVLRGGEGRRVVPRGILIGLTPDRDVVVAGSPLPSADGVGGTFLEMFPLDGIG